MMKAPQEYIDRVREAQSVAVARMMEAQIPRIVIFYDDGFGLEDEQVEWSAFVVDGQWDMNVWSDWIVRHVREHHPGCWFVGIAIVFRVPTPLGTSDILALAVCERMAANVVAILVKDAGNNFVLDHDARWSRLDMDEEDNLAYNMMVPMRQLVTLQG